jgi:hypothetical protein
MIETLIEWPDRSLESARLTLAVPLSGWCRESGVARFLDVRQLA